MDGGRHFGAFARWAIAVSSATALIAATAPGLALACSCISGSRMAMFERATDVFVGKVVEGPPGEAASEVEPGSSGASTASSSSREATGSAAAWGATGAPDASGASSMSGVMKRHFQIEVSETLKGVATGQVDVDTPGSEAACGFSFEVGKTYVVFARRGAHGLHTDLCSGTVTGEGMAPTLEQARELSAFAHAHRMLRAGH